MYTIFFTKDIVKQLTFFKSFVKQLQFEQLFIFVYRLHLLNTTGMA